MTTNIKAMQSAGLDDYIALYEDGYAYEVVKEGDNVYTLGKRNVEKVASFGTSEVEWAVYDGITRSLTYSSDALDPDKERAVTSALKGNSGSFTLDGILYNYRKTTGKNYAITRMVGGFVYSSTSLSSAFESAAENADINQVFSFDGKEYFVSENGDSNSLQCRKEYYCPCLHDIRHRPLRQHEEHQRRVQEQRTSCSLLFRFFYG